jgi:hypothetical protein
MNSNLIYLHHYYVAGLQYYDALHVWNQLSIGTELELKVEPENKYDRHAVALFLKNAKLGYLPRSENRHIAKILKAGWKPYEVRIQSIHNNRDMHERLEICIRIKEYKKE